MKAETIVEVVKKLVGNVYPVGETYADEEALKNLKEFKRVITLLVGIVIELSNEKDHPFGSVQEIGKESYYFLQNLVDYINKWDDDDR